MSIDFKFSFHDFEVTAATEQGLRDHQEDRCVISSTRDNGLLLAVMDGHNGDKVAQLCADYLAELWRQGTLRGLSELGVLGSVIEDLAHMTGEYQDEGSTISIVHIPDSGEYAFVATLGDSPVVAERASSLLSVSPSHNVRLSPRELYMARERGALDMGDGYIRLLPYGPGLQMSRSLGDGNLGAIVSKVPELYSVKLGDFLLLATDGVFGCDNRDFEVQVKRVVSQIRDGADALALVQDSLPEDNATAILVRRVGSDRFHPQPAAELGRHDSASV